MTNGLAREFRMRKRFVTYSYVGEYVCALINKIPREKYHSHLEMTKLLYRIISKTYNSLK